MRTACMAPSTVAALAAALALGASACVVHNGGGGGGRGGGGGDRSERVTCESDDGRRRVCTTRYRIARVELAQRLSKARCEYGRSWGFDDRAIWVDDGCRARFRVTAGSGGQRDGDRDRRVRCESQEGRPRTCETGVRIGRVELTRRLSQSPCRRGESWGFRGNEIWVDRGCRADFHVYPR
jgi:hypothetical protein